MVPYIPPELTDTIIRYCATGRDSTLPGLSSSKANSTLSACSLVCKNWFPASRFLAFSSITLRCTPGHIRSLTDVVTSPVCTLQNIVHKVRFVIPHGKPGVYVHEDVTQNMFVQLLECLRPKSITIEGSDDNLGTQSPPPVRKPVLIREQLFRTLTDTFSHLHKTQTILPITSLTLSSLLFETFSDTTRLLLSFPDVTSLTLCNLAYVAPSVPCHLPLRKLKSLHIVGRQTPSLMALWLMTPGEMLRSPIQEMKMSEVSDAVDVQRMGNYLAANRRIMRRLEIEFQVGWAEKGMGVLRRVLDQHGCPEDLPQVVVHKS